MADLDCSRVDYDNALFPELNEYLAASPKVHKGKSIVTYKHKEDEEGKSINVTYKHKEEEEEPRSTNIDMIHEGYHVDDQIRTKLSQMNLASGSQSNAAGVLHNSVAEMQQYPEAVSGQPSNEVAKLTNSGNASLNSSQNPLANARMLPPGNSPALQMSQGLLSGVSIPQRSQQLDPQSLLHLLHQWQQQQHLQLQQQHLQLQQQLLQLLQPGPTTLSHFRQNSNMQLGNPMVSEASPLQLQALQQQQQQQPQMQRKMMMGLGTAEGVGNMGNDRVGLGDLGNATSMGAAGGIGTGMLAPMTPISGIGNVGQNPMNLSQVSNITTAISQQLQSGSSPQQAAPVARMAQNQANMLGGPQSSLARISGTRQKHPGSSGLSMLGQTLNNTSMSTMQQATKLMTGMAGMGIYMNQQQPPQLQQQQLQQQQQQQQLQLQQQQETTSPLQAVVSPSQVGSPSTMVIPQLNQQMQQQQASPQQMGQRTPMRPPLSSLIHARSAGNPDQGWPNIS